MGHSYSSLKNFNTCPRQYAEVRVWKNFTSPPGKEAIRGQAIHKAFEEYLLGKAALAEDLAGHAAMLDAIKAGPGEKFFEKEFAIDAGFAPVDFADARMMFRGVADVAIVDGERGFILDFKTGSSKYPDLQQLEDMALVMFLHFPEVRVVKGLLLFSNNGVSVRAGPWFREELRAMCQRLQLRIKVVDSAIARNSFAEKKSGLCKGWCPVTTCQHYQPKKES